MSADRPPVAAQRYEVIGQAGPAVDLDQQLGQIDLGHAGSTSFVQPRFLGRLGGIDDELAIGQLRLRGRVSYTGELLSSSACSPAKASRRSAPSTERSAA